MKCSDCGEELVPKTEKILVEIPDRGKEVKKEVNGYWYEQFKRDYPAMIEYIEKRIKDEARRDLIKKLEKKLRKHRKSFNRYNKECEGKDLEQVKYSDYRRGKESAIIDFIRELLEELNKGE